MECAALAYPGYQGVFMRGFRSRSSLDIREIKIHVYAKREFVPRDQVFPLFFAYSLLLLRKNK